MQRTHVVSLIAVCTVLTGCSITQTVEPIKQARVSQVCVLDNKSIHMNEFQPEVQRQIESKNIPTKVYAGARPTDCSHHLEYTANWQWDMAMYLVYAQFRVYDANGLAGQAVYNARNGGGRLDKFGRTADKIRPLIDQLFASVTPGPVLVPAVTETQAAGSSPDRAVRLQELQRLQEQGLITDEEFAARRQAILDGI